MHLLSCVRTVELGFSLTTDLQGRSQTLRHFYLGMGLKLGVFVVLPLSK